MGSGDLAIPLESIAEQRQLYVDGLLLSVSV